MFFFISKFVNFKVELRQLEPNSRSTSRKSRRSNSRTSIQVPISECTTGGEEAIQPANTDGNDTEQSAATSLYSRSLNNDQFAKTGTGKKKKLRPKIYRRTSF